MASKSVLFARQPSRFLTEVSSQGSQGQGGQNRTPLIARAYKEERRSTRKAPFLRTHNHSTRSSPQQVKHLRVQCIQQNETSGVRSPSYTASEAIKISRSRFKEELSKQDDEIDLAKAALLVAAEDQAFEVYNFCKKLSAALKEGREPPVLPSTFANAKKDVNIAIGTDGPLQLRVGGHTLDYWLGFLGAISREVETRFSHTYGEDGARFPLRMITLVNEILFSEFGFNGNIRPGDVRNSYLHLTLQTGRGTATMMSILYIEILKRVGLKMVGAPLSSEHFLCWPMIDGVQLAFDPNHQGRGYLWNDIEHMYRKMLPFQVATRNLPSMPQAPAFPSPSSPRSGPTSPRSKNSGNVEEVVQAETELEELPMVEELTVRPASNRQIVGSILRTLRNISLQQAVRAIRGFALLAPLGHTSSSSRYSLAPASMQGVLDKDRMRHAISLSERLMIVTPDDQTVKRDHALMLYHNKQYSQARAELESFIQMDISERERESGHALMERIGLLAMEERLLG